jgi:nitrate reductase NapE component
MTWWLTESGISICYTTMLWMTLHQGNHLRDAEARDELTPFARILMTLTSLTSIAFIVWYGFYAGFLQALLLLAIGVISRMILMSLARYIGLDRIGWAFSYSGLFLVPVMALIAVRLTLLAH